MEGLGIFGDLPQLAHDDRVNPFGGLPQLDPLPAVGSNHAQALQTRDDMFDSFAHLPQVPVVKTSTAVPVVGGKHVDGLPSLPHFDCDSLDMSHLSERLRRERPHKCKRKHEGLADKSIPWRKLSYLRVHALVDIEVVAKLYGDDLLDISLGESFLNLEEARKLLESTRARRWWHCLNKQGELKLFELDNYVDLLEIFSGCGHLTLGAARQGLQVGPSIDMRPGIGHDDAFSIDIKKPSDRKLVWALVVVLCPRWIHCGFPSNFWMSLAHLSRIRDLDQNEEERMEALLYITFSRQLVYYQVSHRRHSSIENPKGSVAWDLDIVQDMMGASNMRCVDVPLCAWGVKDMWSGKFFDKTMRFACTFNMEHLARKCPKDHEHGRNNLMSLYRRSAISGQYPLSLCEAWASLAKTFMSPQAHT